MSLSHASVQASPGRPPEGQTDPVASTKAPAQPLSALLWSALAMLGVGLGAVPCPTEIPDEHEEWLGIG